MRLFKNGVGRPSNEVAHRRKLFAGFVIGIVLTLVGLGVFIGVKFFKGNLNSGLFNLFSSPVSIKIEAYNVEANKPISYKGSVSWTNKDVRLPNWRNYNVKFKIKAFTTNTSIKSITIIWNDGGYNTTKAAEANLMDKKSKNTKVVYSDVAELDFKADGIRYGYITAVDDKGKSRTVKVRLSIDTTAPSVSWKNVEDSNSSKIIVQATCSDKMSGVRYMHTYDKNNQSLKEIYNLKKVNGDNSDKLTPIKSYSQKINFNLSNSNNSIVTQCIDVAYNDTGFKTSSVVPNNSNGQKVMVTFNKNGATGIGSTKLTCLKDGNSCQIKMPTITRSDGVVVGWSTDAKAKDAKIRANEVIKVSNDTTYYAISYENYVANFKKNGATSIGATSKKCKVYNKEGSCKIKTPSISRSGWEIVGWNVIKTSTSESTSIKPNSELVLIYPKSTYYALTKKVNKLTIKNGSTTVDTLSCTAYSSNCSVNVFTDKYKKLNYKTYLYTYNNKKYLVEGFKTSSKGDITYNLFLDNTSSSQAKKLADLKLDGNKTLYISLVPISNVLTYKNKTVYVESGFDSLAKTRMSNICKWAPYLCNANGDVFVLSKDTYYSRWSGSSGVCYDGVPRDVDVIAANNTTTSGNNYDAWMHELGHAWDFYYKNKMGKLISEQDDFQKLYKYYIKNNGSYSDLPATEFFAAMMPTYVYFKNGIDGSKYNFKYYYWKTFVTSKTEKNLKDYMLCVFDKYVSISNNNYKIPSNLKTCKYPY